MKPSLVTSVVVPLVLSLAACQPSGSSGSSEGLPGVIPMLPDPEERDMEIALPPTFPEPGAVCLWTRRDYSHGSELYPALAPHSDVVFPGAAIQSLTLYGGIPAGITAPRGGGTIVLTSANGSVHSSESLDEITLGNVNDAINRLIAAQPSSFAADLVLSIQRLRSREELQLAIGANASFMGLFDASARFDWREDHRVSHFLVTMRQNFYTVAFDRPSRPGDFFAPEATAKDFEHQVFDGNPPGYISEVTYGRVFYLLIQAREEEAAMAATLSANLELGILDTGSDGSVDWIDHLDEVRIQAYAYGGDQAEVLDSIAGGLGTLGSFIRGLKSANHLLDAKPLSYTVRDLTTNLVVKNGYNVEYDYSSCTFPGVCAPTLLSPVGDRMDNGCAVDPDPVEWQFRWSPTDCADGYQIEVFRPQGNLYYVGETTDTVATVRGTQGFAESAGWKWRVRARSQGAWQPWSAEGTFSLEELDADCLTGIELFNDIHFNGLPVFIPWDVANLQDWSFNDRASSVRLHNVRGVELFEHSNFRGLRQLLLEDSPDLRPLGLNDKVSSIRLLR